MPTACGPLPAQSAEGFGSDQVTLGETAPSSTGGSTTNGGQTTTGTTTTGSSTTSTGTTSSLPTTTTETTTTTGADEEGTCPTPLLNCEGTCVDPDSSLDFCGANHDCRGASAGVSCSAQQICHQGVCQPADGWEPFQLVADELSDEATLLSVGEFDDGHPYIAWSDAGTLHLRSAESGSSWSSKHSVPMPAQFLHIGPSRSNTLVTVAQGDERLWWNRFWLETGMWEFAEFRAISATSPTERTSFHVSTTSRGAPFIGFYTTNDDTKQGSVHLLSVGWNDQEWSSWIIHQHALEHPLESLGLVSGSSNEALLTWQQPREDEQTGWEVRGLWPSADSRGSLRAGNLPAGRALSTMSAYALHQWWVVCWMELQMGKATRHCSRAHDRLGEWGEPVRTDQLAGPAVFGRDNRDSVAFLVLDQTTVWLVESGPTSAETWTWREPQPVAEGSITGFELETAINGGRMVMVADESGHTRVIRFDAKAQKWSEPDDFGRFAQPAKMSIDLHDRGLMAGIRGDSTGRRLLSWWSKASAL